jgi:hypothetical protein
MILNKVIIENSNQVQLAVTELEDWQLLETSVFTFIIPAISSICRILSTGASSLHLVLWSWAGGEYRRGSLLPARGSGDNLGRIVEINLQDSAI